MKNNNNYIIENKDEKFLGNFNSLDYNLEDSNSNALGVGALNTNLSEEPKLDPYYITGFSDAESSFTVSLINSNKEVKKYSPRLIFKIELNIREKFLLDRVAAFFGVGIKFILVVIEVVNM